MKREKVPDLLEEQLDELTLAKRAQMERDWLFERTLDLLCVVDDDSRYRRLNPAWKRVLGYEPEALIGRSMFELIHPDDLEPTNEVVERVRKGEAIQHFENRYRCQDGRYRWISWSAAPLLAGRLRYGMGRDVTERRELQHKLAIADRMASVGTLAAGVAHEINNPLAYVIANLVFAREFLQSQRDRLGNAPWLEETLDVLSHAREGSERIRDIVRNLRTLSRSDEETRERLDLRQPLDTACSIVAHEIRHRARLVRDYQELRPVEANESRVCQVFVNLLVNAAQAIPEGEADRNEIHLATRMEGDRAVVEIRDSGPGIPPEVLPRIFDPFFTTKPVGMGTGLGLSICHGIAVRLGGEIQVQSELGQGTTVRLILPAVRAPEPVSAVVAARPVSTDGVLRRGRIFVVDDEPAIGSIFQLELGGRHDVQTFTSGREALARLREGAEVDIVFCDLMMPDMTGMTLHEELQRIRPDVASRVIFISGGAFTPRGQSFLSSVSNPRLEKPFDVDEIHRLVQTMLA